MVVGEASVTRARGADGSGCTKRVALDRLVFQSSKDWRSESVHLTGCDPLVLGLERMLCKGAWVDAA